MSKVIAVVSIKGGVGKTSCVTNLGAAFVNTFNKKVLLIDANFTAPNLGIHLGLTNPQNTIHDLLLGKTINPKAVYTYEGMHFIPGSVRGKRIKPSKLKDKVEQFRNDYDIILIDSSPNLTDEIIAAMTASDELLIVTTPDYPTLSTTMRAVKVAHRKGANIGGIILNRVKNKKFELSIADIEDATKTIVLAVLPEDITVPASIADTTPAILHSPYSNISSEFNKLAACLIGAEFNDRRWLARLKSMFSFGISKEHVNRTLYKGR